MEDHLGRLPVIAVTGEVASALASDGAAVLVAPPGAGKTTAVPLVLIDAPWLAGQRIIMLEPRRIAARMAAARMAVLLGEAVGERVGYAVRFERRVGPRTRIEVVTEGLLTRRLQSDPGLDGVGLVIFDELHERSLHGDLALALCLDARDGLRPDLRLLAMSATLDAAPVAALLGDAPVIRSAGRAFPVETRHLAGEQPLEQQVLAAVEVALAGIAGDVLVFLPGAAEIRRSHALLTGRLGQGVAVMPLHGDLPSAAQDAALRPDGGGRRKVVLATDIAETSLTIPGIRAVVDSGLARRPRFSPRTGMSRLETVRIALASADQRRGRAGREAPGLCIRLWSAVLERAMPAFAAPEIMEGDLVPLALELAAWGTADAQALRWLTPPPAAGLGSAMATLKLLGALDEGGRITTLGRRMAALPVHPRLARMVIAAPGDSALALACLLSGRDPWRAQRETDLDHRLGLWRGRVGDPGALRELDRLMAQLGRAVGRRDGAADQALAGPLLALAFPDRIAQRRGDAPGRYRLANGRGAALRDHEALAMQRWLVVADLDDSGADPVIRAAAALPEVALEELARDLATTTDEVAWNDVLESVQAHRVTRLGALVLKETVLRDPDPALVQTALLAAIRQRGLAMLPWSDSALAMRARLAFLHASRPDQVGAVDDPSLLASLDEWLGPWLAGVARRADLARIDLTAALRGRVDETVRRSLDRLVPVELATGDGRHHRIDYTRDPPTVSVRLQLLLGHDRQPSIMDGAIPLAIELLSPAGRPIQVTRDLPAFWRGSYSIVRKEMRGRYPKHAWPEDPLAPLQPRTPRPGS